MSKIRPAICRCGIKFWSRWTNHNTTELGRIISVRHKTDDAKTSRSVVVEKEKKTQRLVDTAVNWDVLPNKITESGEFISEFLKHPTKQKQKGRHFKDDEILYYFREEEDLENWFVHTDEFIGGKTWGDFVRSDNGMTAAFQGYVSQRLPRHMLPSANNKLEQKSTYTGYACLQTKPFLSFFNREDCISISGFNVFEIRLRGDGRKYLFETKVGMDTGIDRMYTIPIHTRGGPEWETVRIPYSKFIASNRSNYTVIQEEFDVHQLTNFRFLLLDGIQGPFQLELDYIALCRDFTESTGHTDYFDPFQGINIMIGSW